MKKVTACLVTGALALAVLAPVAPAFAATDPSVASDASGLQSRLDRLTSEDGMAGALGHVRDADGVTTTLASGTSDRSTGAPMVGPEGRFRVASMTKPILAATVVRLAERGRIDLDAPVERYLPGVVRGTGDGAGTDGRRITVRMLLQQTSGLREYTDVVAWKEPYPDFLKVALARTPTRRGEFAYANTNYLVLGMIVQAVTGKDFRRASAELVLKPYGMRDSYWPAKGDNGLRGPHARTYGVSPASPEAGEVDLTDQLPTYLFGASGGLISTPADLNRFWNRAPLSELAGRTVPIKQDGWPAGSRYGKGVARAKLSCGYAWFHGGDMPGASVISGRDRAGRTATVYVTGLAATPKQREHLFAAFDAAICAK
ncbi:beta-lactamase family protein [Nonomuraea sp. NN258]|uniref:serine hydrolase domain-containing protein n=1 Tax=Nonomuraea antri TaxID=2730852 RepID=UPI0015692863|nr:serine hydrolase domain-containing protein [Nonomuraea antri]NRQ36726.1 beta-lactamase family protein [Nonomuraea antri]